MKIRTALIATITLTSCAAALAAGKDRTFATEAADSNMAEIATGQIAQRKSESDAIRAFGNKMVADHTKANNELSAVEDRGGGKTPQGIMPPHKRAADHLEHLSSAEFDRAYAKQMVADHEEAVALFEKESRDGSDPEMQRYATETLPTLREHLRMAKQLAGHDDNHDGRTSSGAGASGD